MLVSDTDLADFTIGLLANPLLLAATRSVEIVFAYRSPAHYAYFRVKDTTPRAVLGRRSGEEEHVIASTDAPHVRLRAGQYQRIKLEQDSADGRIAGYIHDMSAPILAATVSDLPPGRVGVGSRDTPCNFRELRLIGSAVRGSAWLP